MAEINILLLVIRIGLLSDTHSYLDKKMMDFLASVDEIWHAGDVGDVSVLDELKNYKKVRAVYGNIDNHIIRKELKETEIFQIEKRKVLMTHIGAYPPKYTVGIKKLLRMEKPDIFICGHSHILKVIYDNELQCLHLNPGGSGKHGFHKVRTMLRFTINNSEITDLELWEHPR